MRKAKLERSAQLVQAEAEKWASSPAGKKAIRTAVVLSKTVRSDLRKAKEVDVSLLYREMTV